MPSIYDEINEIKKGNAPGESNNMFDFSSIDLSSIEEGSVSDFKHNARNTGNDSVYDTPHYIGQGFGIDGFGDSQYDRNYMTGSEDINEGSLENLRAERQPWYDQVTNNLLNMGVIATTTFADSFVGTIGGAINLAFTPAETEKGLQGYAEERLDTFVANPVSL